MRELGDWLLLMLRNKGLLWVGGSVADAFMSMYFFEAACMIQVRAQAGGGALRLIGDDVLAGAHVQFSRVTKGVGGRLAWPALLRKLDRCDPGYRS